ncbi:hypothetical protein SAY86_000849 [Trapa natans]|uniref:Uncharacterized protein n=1 Tax=Trapa natans TaxID=22666 RepID=A0AAN7MFN2_TRANT|nr:hypothetical protein SAY86_000849 [Trapa natans]
MGRSPCCEKAHTNKGAWTKEEDEKLIAYIRAHGEGCWRSLPKAAGLLRCGKSCRLRWINYLRPDLKRGNFTEEEDELIIKLHSLLGNKWSLIAGRLPGRTDNEIKNYWNTHIRRKLLSRGIDPATHRPLGEPEGHLVQEANATANICFAANSKEQQVAKVKKLENHSRNGSNLNGFLCKERCPDLNLELRISPPSSQYQAYGQSTADDIAAEKKHCFDCNMGLKSSRECLRCRAAESSKGHGSSTMVGYDFLGLKTKALEFRS